MENIVEGFQKDEKEIAKVLGKTLGDVILPNWCSPSEIAFFKKQYDLQEIERAGEEYFYLLMFLVTYSCQVVFIKNKDLLEIILDNLHKYVTEKKFNLPKQIFEAQDMENKLRDRYAQYYDLLRNKEGNVDLTFFMRQLPYNFFANTLEKDLDYVFFDKKFLERWGRSRIKLSFWIGEMFKEIIDFLIGMQEKYKINGQQHFKTIMNLSRKSQNSQNYSTLEEFMIAADTALKNSGITVKEKTAQPEPTNKFLVKFLKYPKKKPEEK